MLTYLPIVLNEQENCVVFVSHDIVRVYDNIPSIGSSSSYTDYYITDHYTSISGVDNISESIICSSLDNFTNNVFYRFDISDILVSFACIFFVSIFMIYFALKCFFRGLFK